MSLLIFKEGMSKQACPLILYNNLIDYSMFNGQCFFVLHQIRVVLCLKWMEGRWDGLGMAEERFNCIRPLAGINVIKTKLTTDGANIFGDNRESRTRELWTLT